MGRPTCAAARSRSARAACWRLKAPPKSNEGSMAAWLPLLKASLPYISQLVTTAIPAFTSRTAGKLDDVVPKQIAELQAAVTDNAEAVKTLAAQLKQAIEVIDAGQREIQVLRRLVVVATVLALLGASLAAWALLAKS